MVYQHASQTASFNKLFVIMDDIQKDKLVEECNLPNKELLNLAFARHCDAMNFHGDSGLTPHMILSLHVYIQRISPSFYRYADEEIAE